MKGIECVCGATHESNLRILERLEEATARGSHIFYIGQNESTLTQLQKFFRVSRYEGDSIYCYTGEKFNSFLNPFLEDIKTIFAQGNGIDKAKKIASENNLRLILIGEGNLSGHSFYEIDGFISLIKTSPDIIKISDTSNFEINSDQTAIGFCRIMMTLLSLFEWDISSLIYDEKICPYIFKRAKKVAIDVFERAKEYGKHSINLRKAIYKAQIELAELDSYIKSPFLLVNGAIQSASAQHLLFRHEERNLKSLEENAFIFTILIVKIYLAFLNNPISFSPPPDNNLRISRINEYLGVDEEKAQQLMTEYFNKIDLTDYRLGVYREDLKRHLEEIKTILERAYVMFFRLYEDDGFSYRGYLDNLDASLCIGLGSDIFKAKTLLTYMRHKGLLDKYIL